MVIRSDCGSTGFIGALWVQWILRHRCRPGLDEKLGRIDYRSLSLRSLTEERKVRQTIEEKAMNKDRLT